jgi:hypothetical protein
MNRLVHQPKEVEQPSKPHMARRAIRYRAADNAREAMRRQFPSMFTPQTSATPSPESLHHA